MSGPTRIQRRRTKGWRMPEGAIYVGRGSAYGNPYRVSSFMDAVDQVRVWAVDGPDGESFGTYGPEPGGFDPPETRARLRAVDLYARNFERGGAVSNVNLDELRGHDLACWCRLDQPCHADVLLELANADR